MIKYEVYKNNLPEYYEIENTKIIDVQSKHISLNTPNEISKTFEDLSKKVNYKFCYMSVGNNFSTKYDRDYVKHIAKQYVIRPAKFVVSKDGRIWADNTHTSLALIIKLGINVKICNCPYYIVDFRNNIRVINTKVLPAKKEIIDKTVINALKIQNRINKGWRPPKYSYTIGDLFFQGEYFSIGL